MMKINNYFDVKMKNEKISPNSTPLVIPNDFMTMNLQMSLQPSRITNNYVCSKLGLNKNFGVVK